MISKKTLAAIAIILIPVGVLAALLQAAEDPPTELYVRTTPAGATLFLDGKELGTAPDVFEVAPGKHELLAVLEGYKSAKREIVVPATRIERVILTLEVRSPSAGTGVKPADRTPAGDEKSALAALKQLGATVMRNADGRAKTIYMKETGATNMELALLKGMADLEYLDLFGINISDAGLVHLKGLTKLERLSLNGTNVTGDGLKHLKGLTKLKSLNLYGTKVSDAGLEHLKAFTELETLTLPSNITDAGLVHLRGLPKLGSLDLSFTQITDTGLEHLKSLPNLKSLGLRYTQITDAGLVHLKDLTKLRWLLLTRTRITDAGRAELRRALPALEYSTPWAAGPRTEPRTSPPRTEPPSFGPVIERVVNDDKVGNDWLIDLDAGKLYTPPQQLDPEKNREADPKKLVAWARQRGIDATGVKASEGILVGVDLVVAFVDEPSWESVTTPQQVRDALERAAHLSGDIPLIGGEDVPGDTLYAFRTREGGMGVLQIAGRGDDPPSVKIRYKLVQETVKPPAEPSTGITARSIWDRLMNPPEGWKVQKAKRFQEPLIPKRLSAR